MKKVNLFFQSELSGISFEIFSITSFVIACTILEVDTGYLYKVKDKFPKDKNDDYDTCSCLRDINSRFTTARNPALSGGLQHFDETQTNLI